MDGILINNSTNITISNNTIYDSARSNITKGKNIDVTEGSTNVFITNNIIGYSTLNLSAYKGIFLLFKTFKIY